MYGAIIFLFIIGTWLARGKWDEFHFLQYRKIVLKNLKKTVDIKAHGEKIDVWVSVMYHSGKKTTDAVLVINRSYHLYLEGETLPNPESMEMNLMNGT